MKFVDYINVCIKKDMEFDAVIGDVEMPATFSFIDDMEITSYCMNKYGDLLNSECDLKVDPTGRYTDVVNVDYEDYELGERFTYAVAGYISPTEYNLLFNC